MYITLSIVAILVTTGFMTLKHPIFGKAPSGKRLQKIQQSPNYKDGKFQNISFTPDLTEGYSFSGVLWDFMFKKHPNTVPVSNIPSVKTDIKSLPLDSNVFIWFGHSSYYMQLEGKRFLIDPVFSGNASPIPGSNKSFKGSDVYSAEDFPDIDYLLITHDHYDHLDYYTIKKILPKIKQTICGLGVGEHLEFWGMKADKITEKDWNDSLKLENNITIFTATTRHFSGRGIKRNNTLWLSFIVQTPNLQLYLGGDGGYDSHFAKIGEKFGEFDYVILENGQYNLAWQAIHMLPTEVYQAATDLKAKNLIPVHSSKFKLAFHPWNEPLTEITKICENKLPVSTPKIGEVLYLNQTNQTFTKWWENVK